MRNIVIAGLIGLIGSAPVWAADPFLGNLGGSFELTDQFGELRTEKSPDGKAQLVFFWICKLSRYLHSCPAPDGGNCQHA